MISDSYSINDRCINYDLFSFFTISQSHGQHINLLCRAACWTSSPRQKTLRDMPPRAGPLLPGPASPFAPRPGLGTRQRIPAPPCARSPRSSPAHDLVCQEDPAHLGVLVLPFVDDGLRGERGEVRARSQPASPHRSWPPGQGSPAGRCARSPGTDPFSTTRPGLGGRPRHRVQGSGGYRGSPPIFRNAARGKGKKYVKTILR